MSRAGQMYIPHCPCCSGTLREPIRLDCLHSYCKICLDNISIKEEIGWKCQKCDTFTTKTNAKPDKLLEKLLLMQQSQNLLYSEMCKCDKKHPSGYCSYCKVLIYSRGKVRKDHHSDHSKPPHHILTLEDAARSLSIIDDHFQCTQHNQEKQIYCSTHHQLVCSVCVYDHQTCSKRSSENSLTELTAQMHECNTNIANKLAIVDRQTKAVKEERQKVKAANAKWLSETDKQLESFIKRLKESKANINERVRNDEHKNLKNLDEVEIRLQMQAERFRSFHDLYNKIILKRTINKSQLLEIDHGVLQQGKKLIQEQILVENYEYKTPIIDENMYQFTDDEFKKMLYPVNYDLTCSQIDQFVDFDKYLKQSFTAETSTKVSMVLCNRVNVIGDYIYTAHGGEKKIKQVNTSATIVREFNDVHSSIVVKKLPNDQLIAGGYDGLYLTNQEFCQWKELQKGFFSDIAIHGDQFSALEYKQCKVLTFKLSKVHAIKSSFDIAVNEPGDWIADGNETMAVDSDNHVIICSKMTFLIYSLDGRLLKRATFLSPNHQLAGTDKTGHVLLCNSQGKLYCIRNVQTLDPAKLEEHLVLENDQVNRDMTIDGHGNIWILHGNQSSYNLTKYVPL